MNAHATTPRVDQFTNSEVHECTKPHASRVDQFTNSEVHESTNPRVFTNPDGCSRVFTNPRIHEFTNPRIHGCSRIHGRSRMHVCSARSFIRNGLLRVVFRARYVPNKNDTYSFFITYRFSCAIRTIFFGTYRARNGIRAKKQNTNPTRQYTSPRISQVHEFHEVTNFTSPRIHESTNFTSPRVFEFMRVIELLPYLRRLYVLAEILELPHVCSFLRSDVERRIDVFHNCERASVLTSGHVPCSVKEAC